MLVPSEAVLVLGFFGRVLDDDYEDEHTHNPLQHEPTGNNLYSRVFFIAKGGQPMRRHDQAFALNPGTWYAILFFTTANMTCQNSFSFYYCHFASRTSMGLDLLSIVPCRYLSTPEGADPSRRLLARFLEPDPGNACAEHQAITSSHPQAIV